MSDLEKIRKWVATYPGASRMRDMKVDYFSPNPDNGSIDPSGLLEVSRTEDILGNVTVENQYNFALYFVFLKSPDDDRGATDNAAWLMDFQRWVQEQSTQKQIPTLAMTHCKNLQGHRTVPSMPLTKKGQPSIRCNCPLIL